jgi:RecA/RadA recombinase
MNKKTKDPVNEAFSNFKNLYADGAIVNLGDNPRYPKKVSTGRPSMDYLTDGGFPVGRLILIAGEPSAGKCLGKGTKIKMFDGSIKNVENVKVGDLLIGHDSNPRMVCNLSRGTDEMYKISQKSGLPYLVNSNHTMIIKEIEEEKYSRKTNDAGKRYVDYTTVTREKKETIKSIHIKDLLKIKHKANFRKTIKGIKAGVIHYNHIENNLKIEPYLLGVWLGDGTSNKPQISNADIEVQTYISDFCADNGFNLTTRERNNCLSLEIVTARGKENPFLNNLRYYKVLDNKHIPLQYMTSSLESRLELLAGILDTDGSLLNEGRNPCYDIVQKSEAFTRDIKQLAESCGFYCSNVSEQTKTIKDIGFSGQYFRLYITGDVYRIPTKVKRKIAIYSDFCESLFHTAIEIESVGEGEYFGFELDGPDSTFLLEDQTIIHNSSLTIQLAETFGKRILYVDTEATLTTDYIEALGANPSSFSHVLPETTEIMCDIIRAQIPNFDAIIVDSINNSASNEQLGKSAGDRTMANRALVLSNQLPILVGLCNQHDTTLIVLSQIRDNMNKANKYSPDTVIPGGRSLHHNSSLTIELFTSSKIKDTISKEDVVLGGGDAKEEISGKLIRMKCTKNKVGKADRTVKVDFLYGEGYVIENDVAAAAFAFKIITMAGSWVKYGDTSLTQGRASLRDYFKENPEVYNEIKMTVDHELEQLK